MSIAIARLIEAGFIETCIKDICAGTVVYTKRLAAADIPYARVYVIDDDWVMPYDEALLVVTQDRHVQLIIDAADWSVGPLSIDSEKGREIIRGMGIAI